MKTIIQIACVLILSVAPTVEANDFFSLVEEGTAEEVKSEIESGADLSARNDIGWTPLMYAARFNENPKVIETLVESGANVSARNDDGWTPLMYAAINENPEVINVLLESGAD